MADAWGGGGGYLTEGDIVGTQYRKKNLVNTETPCRKSTKYRYRMYDRLRLLKNASVNRYDPANILSNLSLCEKTWEDLDLPVQRSRSTVIVNNNNHIVNVD